MSGVLLAAGLGAAGLGLSLRFNWWRKKRSGTPILMYHQIGDPRPGSALNKWRVTEGDFHWQLDTLVRRGIRGAALRELLEAQGGKISLLSEPGRGLEVTIMFPLYKPEAA